MKKLIFLSVLLIGLLGVYSSRPEAIPLIELCGQTETGLSCSMSTVQQSEETDSAYVTVGYDGAAPYWSTQVNYTGTTGTLCAIDLLLSQQGTASGNATVYLYANDGGAPAATPIITLGSVVASTIGTPSWVTFTGTATTTITNGTTYHIVLYFTGTTGYWLRWESDNSAAAQNIDNSEDGASWSDYTTNYSGTFKIYIEE